MKSAENNTTNEQAVYKFRFDQSNQLIELTQSHLNRIPYLQALVAHKDDFSSIQNDQNEYLLHHPIRYHWFQAILHAITTERPYTLFNELPETENILDVIQLHDYLGLSSFPLPLLNEPNLVLSNPLNHDNKGERIEYTYKRANCLSEVRDAAAKFVLALTRDVYDLHSFRTIECIFSLISVLFSDERVFSSRFRSHTFTIVKEYLFPLFSIKNVEQLSATLEQRNPIDSKIYLDDGTQPLPTDFENAFAWQGAYLPAEKRVLNILVLGPTGTGKSAFINALFGYPKYNSSPVCTRNVYTAPSFLSLDIIDTPSLFGSDVYTETTSSVVRNTDKKQYISEAQSARSGRFNTTPKQPQVDKFKHRCGPKAQKHR